MSPLSPLPSLSPLPGLRSVPSRALIGLRLGIFSLALTAAPPLAEGASCPNVGIVLDRSASMNLAPDGNAATAGNPSRWSIAVDAVNNIVSTNDGKFPMGLVFFPLRGTTMCETKNSFDIPIGYGKKAEITTALMGTTPGGNTPTAGAIRGAITDPALQATNREQYLILITDGQPCCATACTDYDVQRVEAVKAVEEAFGHKPPIRTFVVGFGQLNPQFTAALNEMADAGGKPASATGPIRFYQADSAASLNMALDSIIKTVVQGGGDVGGMVSVCDDSCYASGCPAGDPRQICVAGQCKSDPCTGYSCGFGEYCFTDGTSASCASPCWQSCQAGQRCVRGSCQASACAEPCPSGSTCDEATRVCRTDPRCTGVACKTNQGCVAGQCVDDPCQYVKCPQETTCVALEGTCQPLPGARPPDPNAIGGCSCDLGRSADPARAAGPAGATAAAAASMLATLLFRLRRRRSASNGFTSQTKFGE
jgi:hypothetical protein